VKVYHVFPDSPNAPPSDPEGYQFKWQCMNCGELFAIRQTSRASCVLELLLKIEAVYRRYADLQPATRAHVVDRVLLKELGLHAAERSFITERYQRWVEWKATRAS
jgi:hypothetical protein